MCSDSDSDDDDDDDDNDILTGITYLEFLRDNLPEFLEEVPLMERDKVVF